MQRVLKTHLSNFISLVAASVLLAVTLIWFCSRMSMLSLETGISKLSGNAKSLAAAVSIYLDERISELDDRAAMISETDKEDAGAADKALAELIPASGFKVIGAADKSGNVNGGKNGSIAGTRVFEEAMKGRASVEFRKEEHGELMVGTPLISDGSIIGAMYGIIDPDDIQRLFSVDVRSSSEVDILVCDDGRIITMSSGATPELARINDLFSEVQGLDNERGKTSVTTCTIGKKEYVIAASPVKKYGMTSISAGSLSKLKNQNNSLSEDVTVMIILVALAFLMPVATVLYLVKSIEDLRRTGEKFRLVTVASQDMVFDYDFQKQLLTLDGNTDNITPENKKMFTRAETLRLIERVHEEDKDIKTRLLDIVKNTETTIKGEFRVKCLDDTYCWFRANGTVVRGHDGNAQRLIGSLINVDEQTSMRTLQKDETDPITGILNKRSFYMRVNEMLKGASDSDLFAMYIIDLDSFNSINDKLGHSIGDSVLSDVAKKLCVVFSDKDIVGRVGGDEFAAFLNMSSGARSVGMNIIEKKAQTICRNMKECYDSKNGNVVLTASVGVAIYPYSGRDYNTLFRNADKALGKVKAAGKNMYRIYSADDEK